MLTEKRKTELEEELKSFDKDQDVNEFSNWYQNLSKEEQDYIWGIMKEEHEKRFLEAEWERSETITVSRENRIKQGDWLIKYLEQLGDNDRYWMTAPILKSLAQMFHIYLDAKKPIRKHNYLTLNPIFQCPVCVINLQHWQPFCSNCGQQIDWTDEE